MDDQLDNELRDHIKEVFENYEDLSADEGWLELRKKFPEQASRRPFAWIWWASAAAILLLFLTIGLRMYTAKNQPDKFSVKPQKHAQTENLAIAKKHSDTITKITPVQPGAPIKTPDQLAASEHVIKKSPVQIKNTSPSSILPKSIFNDTAGKKTYVAKRKDSVKTIVQLPSNQLAATNPSNNQVKTNGIVKQPDQVNTTAVTTTAVNPANTVAANTVMVKPKEPAKATTSMFANDQPAKVKKIDENSPRVHFGLYAATYFNYAKGSDRQANLGAGITSDIRISKNLKLVTGVTIAQNSLNFTNGVPTTTAQTNLAVPAAASAYNAASVVNEASIPAFKNYDASLVGLDIPLNLKYEFNPQKNSTYILAGLSSGTFINETYTYKYNYPALLSPSLQQVQNETSKKSFNGFYFAKTLNVAFGLGYPLGKNRVILEPFLKYPLQGLGSQNIRFGAGGVNLKFNFIPYKK